MQEVVIKYIKVVDEIEKISSLMREVVINSFKISTDNQKEIINIIEGVDDFKKVVVDFSIAMTERISSLDKGSTKRDIKDLPNFLGKKNNKTKPD